MTHPPLPPTAAAMSPPPAPIQLTITPCPAAAQLEPRWRELAARAAPSPFLDWPWIATLLTQAPGRFDLAELRAGDRLAGLAVLGGRDGQRHLNESGEPGLDQVMVEYNGLLAEPGTAEAGRAALLAELAARPIRRLRLSGVDEDWAEACRRQGLACAIRSAPQPAPFTALESLPADDILAGLSRNTRQQIRRSIRHLETEGGGPLRLDAAATPDQALDWLERLEALHQAAWQARGRPGAFTASFRRFHRTLIARHHAEGATDLLRLRAGEREWGYLYLLRRGDTVSAYQSGFRYDDNTLCRPGLVSHALALGHYRADGLRVYRFLAGDARYKRSLATGCDHLVWLEAFSPTPGIRAARLAARIAGKLGRLVGRAFPGE